MQRPAPGCTGAGRFALRFGRTALLRRQTGKEGASILSGLPSEEKTQLFSEVLAPDDQNLMVTPKDIDSQVGDLSKIIGYAIDLALQPGLTIQELELLLS